jgi:thymidylate synthase
MKPVKTADIRDTLASLYKQGQFVTDKTGVKTIELVGASFIADEPSIFGPLNDEYIQKELGWYLSQSLYVKDIGDPVPKIWTAVSSSEGKINSNYGYLIYSKENGEQFDNVLNELCRNKESRRAVAIYTRPSMHSDYKTDGMSDFICTNAVQYLIRDSALHTVVQMRSNDAWAGYRNDYAWQHYVSSSLLKQYNDCVQDPSEEIVLGDMTWQVGSLHIYSRQFYLIEDYIAFLSKQ